MRLPHPFTLALRHLTPGRTIDGVAALPVWLGVSRRLDLAGLAARIEATFAAGLTPAVNLHAGAVDVLGPEERTDILTTAAGVARGRRFIAGTRPTTDAAPLSVRYGRAVDAIARQGGTPLLLPIRELATLDGDALAYLWRQATAGHRGVLIVEMAGEFGMAADPYSPDVVTRLTDVGSLGGLVHATLDRAAEWARVEARDITRPEFRIYSGHERALDMVSYGSDYLLAGAGCAPEAFAARDRAWRAGDSLAFDLNDVLQAAGSLMFRAPIGAARHAALQWLHARGVLDAPVPVPGVALRPESDLALYRELAARLDRLLPSTIAPDPAASAPTAPAL
jgi:dihydrodipicolinate synthase/N-acetylneuraminate lyase